MAKIMTSLHENYQSNTWGIMDAIREIGSNAIDGEQRNKWSGEGKLKNSGPQKHLRSVTMLWQNVEHLAIRSKYVKTGTVDDLKTMKGKRFSIGKRNSGTEGSGRHIMAGLGINPESFNLTYMGYSASADALLSLPLPLTARPFG